MGIFISSSLMVKASEGGAVTYTYVGECIFRAKTARLLPAIFHRPLKPAGFRDA